MLTLGSGGTAAVAVLSGTHTISAPILLAGNVSVNATSLGALVLSGSVGEATLGSSLSLSGNGQLILSGTGSYTGGTFVEGGTLYMTSSTAIANDSNLTVGAGGTFVFDPSVTVTTATRGPAPAVEAVPEPGTLALLIAGLVVGFGVWRRRSGLRT